MNYPREWITSEMLTDALYEGQIARYKWGDERGAEHDRNGAFHWWLGQSPTRTQLKTLLRLSYLDPDQWMAADARRYLRSQANFDSRLAALDRRHQNRYDKELTKVVGPVSGQKRATSSRPRGRR